MPTLLHRPVSAPMIVTARSTTAHRAVERRHIAGYRVRGAPRDDDGRAGLLRPLGHEVVDHHAGAGQRDFVGDRGTDTRPGTGHEHRAAAE